LDAVIATPTVIAERSLVGSVGGFDEMQLFGEDYELWLRLALHSEVSAEELTCVRVHDQHYSGDRIAVYAGWVQIYRKILALVSSSRLRSVCRCRLAESATTLAALYSREGRYSAALRAGASATASGWSSPRWWLMAGKTCGRGLFPRVAP
jgi:hypothetical protein